MPETLASTPINVTGLAVGKMTPGSNAPVSLVQSKILSPVCVSPYPITTVPSTEISSFGGVVTPVNVPVLYQALSNHPEREFVHKLCSELREGAKIGYSSPRCPRFSNNLPQHEILNLHNFISSVKIRKCQTFSIRTNSAMRKGP